MERSTLTTRIAKAQAMAQEAPMNFKDSFDNNVTESEIVRRLARYLRDRPCANENRKQIMRAHADQLESLINGSDWLNAIGVAREEQDFDDSREAYKMGRDDV